jgi:hypothetical protein
MARYDVTYQYPVTDDTVNQATLEMEAKDMDNLLQSIQRAIAERQLMPYRSDERGVAFFRADLVTDVVIKPIS